MKENDVEEVKIKTNLVIADKLTKNLKISV